MAGKQTVSVTITGDSRKLKRALDQAERDTAGFAGKMKGFGASVRSSMATWAPVAGAALIGFGVHAINVASDVEEAGNKIDVVFGKSSDAVKAFGEDAANAMGMSQRDYLQFAGRIGALVKPMGATEEQAAEMSTTLTRLSADLGSFHNVSGEEALTAIASALSGEMEPMKRFGVVLNDAALKAKALEMGLFSGKGTLDAYAKSQAAYQLILENTTDAQGDFERTQDSTANKIKTLQAKFTDLTAELGEKLLPVANVALEGLIKAVDGLSAWWETDGQQWLSDFTAGLGEISTWWDESGQPALERFRQSLYDLGIGSDDFGERWENFKTRFMDGLTNEVLPGVGDFMGMMWRGIKFLGDMGAMALSIYSAVHGALNAILSALGGVLDWIMGKIDAVTSKLGGVTGVVQGLTNPTGWAIDRVTGMLGFDTGGVVPGPTGAPRLAVVHGGETVLPTHKQDMQMGGGTTVVQLVVDGKVFTEQVIEPNLAKSRRAHTGSRRVG